MSEEGEKWCESQQFGKDMPKRCKYNPKITGKGENQKTERMSKAQSQEANNTLRHTVSNPEGQGVTSAIHIAN